MISVDEPNEAIDDGSLFDSVDLLDFFNTVPQGHSAGGGLLASDSASSNPASNDGPSGNSGASGGDEAARPNVSVATEVTQSREQENDTYMAALTATRVPLAVATTALEAHSNSRAPDSPANTSVIGLALAANAAVDGRMSIGGAGLFSTEPGYSLNPGAPLPEGWTADFGGIAGMRSHGTGFGGTSVTPRTGSTMLWMSSHGLTATDAFANDLLEPGTAGTIVRGPSVFLSAETQVSLEWYFTSSDADPYNDFALGLVGNSQVFSFTHTGENDYDSGWQSASLTVAEAGTYQLVLVVSNEADSRADSELYVDNVVGFTLPEVPVAMAEDDFYEFYPNTPLTVSAPGVLANDSGTVGETLTATLIDPPSSGLLQLDQNGYFVYAPASGSDADEITFSYYTTAGSFVSNVATVTLSRGDRPPTVQSPLNQTTAEGTSVYVPISASDPDGDSLQYYAWNLPEGLSIDSSTGVISGTAAYAPSHPAGGYPVTVVVDDPSGASASVDFTWTIQDTNRPPVVGFDTYGVPGPGGITVAANAGLLANDTDPDENPLTVVSVAPVMNGTLTWNANGSFTLVPNNGFAGSVMFLYTVSDGQATASGSVSLNVHSPDQAPGALADQYAIEPGGTLIISGRGVLENDYDPDGDPLQALIVTGPQYGTLQTASDGTFTYVAAAGFTGIDQFTYQAWDGVFLSLPTVVKIHVVPITAVRFLTAAESNGGTTGTLEINGNPNGPQGAVDYPSFDGGDRFFPDAVSANDGAQRNIVRVRATLPNWVPQGIMVYFRSFDVDDPSSDLNIDPNDFGLFPGNNPGDNRGIAARDDSDGRATASQYLIQGQQSW